ncbi:MAG: hemolysin III family protein [Candidatus Bipolaricaulota bacterium]|nr:hemolysin III family protein [Candidatus Bipolaricaulota bacterium]MBS3791091.1 hemolysin III family protein [Candidatus Bipolaricaulota bacterium]
MHQSLKYEPEEEIANSILHGFGILASVAGLVILLLRAIRWNNSWMLISFGIYGGSLILLFLSSTLYHGLPYQKFKKFFRVLDHSSIYILVAGTYTPFTLVSLRNGWGWALFGTIWGLAFGGILFHCISHGRFSNVGTVTYILMGWLSLIVLHQLLSSIGLVGVILLIVGGLIYSLGVIFYKREGLTYNHAIWHLFVLGGGICHFSVVYFFVAPVMN